MIVASMSVLVLQITNAKAEQGQECSKASCNLPDDNCLPFLGGGYVSRKYGPTRTVCQPGSTYSYCTNLANAKCYTFKLYAVAPCEGEAMPHDMEVAVCSFSAPTTPPD